MTTYMDEHTKSMWTANGYFLDCLHCGAQSAATQGDPNAVAVAEDRLRKAHKTGCPAKVTQS